MKVINSEHSHVESAPGAYPVLRKIAMTSEIKSDVTRQFVIRIALFKVLSAVRVDDPLTVNAMFTFRNVYTLQAQIRRDELGPLTPIQALIREFYEGDWIYALQKDKKIKSVIYSSRNQSHKKFGRQITKITEQCSSEIVSLMKIWKNKKLNNHWM